MEVQVRLPGDHGEKEAEALLKEITSGMRKLDRRKTGCQYLSIITMSLFIAYCVISSVQEIYPGLFVPSVSHRFIGHLESQNRLLRNYTQNIDTLESAAGITRVVQCHGRIRAACFIFNVSKLHYTYTIDYT